MPFTSTNQPPRPGISTAKKLPVIRYSIPSNLSLAKIARDLDHIPIISRRRNGRIRAICGMGVCEFFKYANVPYDTYYRMTNRSTEDYRPSSRNLHRIVNAINILRNDVVVHPEWVIQNFQIIPTDKPDQLVPNAAKRRRATVGIGDAIEGLRIMNKYNAGSIEQVVKRHMEEPLTVEAVLTQIKEKKEKALSTL